MIHGVKGFSGAQVTSPDLRGGAALVVAGLIADGTTEVSAIHHIKRGYERFVEKLQALRRACRACYRPRSRHLLIQVAYV